MAQCPSCKQNSIGYFAKYGSSKAEPVQCNHCGALSCMSSKQTGPGVYSTFAIWFSPAIAIAIFLCCESVWLSLFIPVAVVIALLAAHEYILFHRPLVSISSEEVAIARKGAFWFALFLLVLAAAIILLAFKK